MIQSKMQELIFSRSMHFQKQHPQGKLVRVIRGRVFDVAVDLRAGSATYGQWYGVELTAEKYGVSPILDAEAPADAIDASTVAM